MSRYSQAFGKIPLTPPEPHLTVDEAAAYLNVPPLLLHTAIYEGRMYAIRFQRRGDYKIPLSEVLRIKEEAWVVTAQHGIKAPSLFTLADVSRFFNVALEVIQLGVDRGHIRTVQSVPEGATYVLPEEVDRLDVINWFDPWLDELEEEE